MELSQIDERKQQLAKWDQFKFLKDKAIARYCSHKRIEKCAIAVV